MLCNAVWGREIEGVQVPEKVELAGKTLPLNGAGVRIFRLLGLPVKVYVASLHASGAVRSEAELLQHRGPMQLTLTFLRAAGQADVTRSWQKQFEVSCTHSYPGFEKDRDTCVGLFKALEKGSTEVIQIVGEDTLLYDNGRLLGTIRGRDFQRAVLSMWFGQKPVTAELKTALLGP